MIIKRKKWKPRIDERRRKKPEKTKSKLRKLKNKREKNQEKKENKEKWTSGQTGKIWKRGENHEQKWKLGER